MPQIVMCEVYSGYQKTLTRIFPLEYHTEFFLIILSIIACLGLF